MLCILYPLSCIRKRRNERIGVLTWNHESGKEITAAAAKKILGIFSKRKEQCVLFGWPKTEYRDTFTAETTVGNEKEKRASSVKSPYQNRSTFKIISNQSTNSFSLYRSLQRQKWQGSNKASFRQDNNKDVRR